MGDFFHPVVQTGLFALSSHKPKKTQEEEKRGDKPQLYSTGENKKRAAPS